MCHETIYQALYHGGKGGLSRTVDRQAAHRAAAAQAHAAERRAAAPVHRAGPADRPPTAEVVEDRARLGDWEGDLIVGRASRSAIGTLVDRRSRYVRLVHLPDGHARRRLPRGHRSDVLAAVPAAARRTLTWDQGSEMAEHDQLADAVRRGRLLRPPGQPVAARHEREHQRPAAPVLPQGHRPRLYTLEDLAPVEERLNHRPRKILGWRHTGRRLHRRTRLILTGVATPLESALEPARRSGVSFQPSLTPPMPFELVLAALRGRRGAPPDIGRRLSVSRSQQPGGYDRT